MTNIQTIKRILREIIKPYWTLVAASIALMIVIASSNSLQVYLIQPAVDHSLFSVHGNKKILYQIPLLIIVVSIIKGFSTYYQIVLSNIIAGKITRDLRIKLFKSFVHSDMEHFNNTSSAKMISNILNDINGMMGAITLILSGVFKNALSVIFLFGVMLFMNWKLTLISLVGFPLAIGPIIYVFRRLRKHMSNNQIQLENFTVLMDDSLKGIKVVKSYNAEEYEINRFKESTDQLYKLNTKIARTSNIPGPLNEALVGVGIAAVLLYGGSLVIGGNATPGSFFAFFAAMMMAYKPMKAMSNINAQLHMCLVCAKRVFEMFDSLPKIVDRPDAIELKDAKGDIKFDKVSFGYTAERKALDNIDLKIEAGKTHAFVGHSGGGKSTIMSLLLRFYDANEGKITIDGHDIKDISIKSLRNSISYVGQEVQLFDDTVIENIRYNNKAATDTEVIKAAQLAEAHEFITQMPESYASRVGSNGSKLSGGQKQRISIARAILKNSPILLLDEATSALDPISEKLIQKALDNLMKGRTTITIAHRLSTIINADKIFVMQNGKVVEQGTHAELLAKNGQYAVLYSKQFQE